MWSINVKNYKPIAFFPKFYIFLRKIFYFTFSFLEILFFPTTIFLEELKFCFQYKTIPQKILCPFSSPVFFCRLTIFRLKLCCDNVGWLLKEKKNLLIGSTKKKTRKDQSESVSTAIDARCDFVAFNIVL